MKKRGKEKASVSFIATARTIFTVFGSRNSDALFNLINNGPSIDAQALRGDWNRVGNDVRVSMRRIDVEQPVK